MIKSLRNNLRLNSSRHLLLQANRGRLYLFLDQEAECQGWLNNGLVRQFCPTSTGVNVDVDLHSCWSSKLIIY